MYGEVFDKGKVHRTNQPMYNVLMSIEYVL